MPNKERIPLYLKVPNFKTYEQQVKESMTPREYEEYSKAIAARDKGRAITAQREQEHINSLKNKTENNFESLPVNNPVASKEVVKKEVPMANPVKKQIKTQKKQLKQEGKSQKQQLALQQQKNELANNKIRQEAIQAGRPIPFGAQDKATAFHSTEDQPVSIRTNTPQQEDILNRLYQSLPGGLQNLNMPGSQSNFAPIANEARRNFSQNTIPTLAERFAGLGRGSSGLQQSLGGAAAHFESQLASAQAQHGLQEQSLQSNNLFNSLGAFLHPQFDYQIAPGQNSGLRNVWNGAKGLAYNAALGYLNPAGAAGNLAGGLLGGLSNKNNQQQGGISNGTGAGSNSAGFGGVSKPAWQPQQNQLSTQQLAGAGYGLPDMGNPGAFNFR